MKTVTSNTCNRLPQRKVVQVQQRGYGYGSQFSLSVLEFSKELDRLRHLKKQIELEDDPTNPPYYFYSAKVCKVLDNGIFFDGILLSDIEFSNRPDFFYWLKSTYRAGTVLYKMGHFLTLKRIDALLSHRLQSEYNYTGNVAARNVILATQSSFCRGLTVLKDFGLFEVELMNFKKTSQRFASLEYLSLTGELAMENGGPLDNIQLQKKLIAQYHFDIAQYLTQSSHLIPNSENWEKQDIDYLSDLVIDLAEFFFYDEFNRYSSNKK